MVDLNIQLDDLRLLLFGKRPNASFDLVTAIGSTVGESGDYDKFLTACWRMLYIGGRMIFMDFLRHLPERFELWAASNNANVLTRLNDPFAQACIFWLERSSR